MNKIYLIKEIIDKYPTHEKIVGAVSDKTFAKRYCRDMRTRGELTMCEVDADELTMPRVKLYRVECGGWRADEDDNVVEVYQELLKDRCTVFVENEDDFLTRMYAAGRCVRVVNDDYRGARLCFWCFAKNAPAAKAIMWRTLKSFDPSALEWNVYKPTDRDTRKLQRVIKQYNNSKQK